MTRSNLFGKFMTICAIHQPNFFPWAGYFDKIRQADIFIFLDEVAYPKSGSGSGSWCNRVKLLSSGSPSWFGLPIKRESGLQLIKDIEFLNNEYHALKLLKTLKYNYKNSECLTYIESLLMYPTNQLVEYNIHAIKQLSNYLGLHTQFIRQSELTHSKSSTELLIELIKQVNADTYLCGNGCSGYQEDDLFVKEGISLLYQSQDPVSNMVKDLNPEHASFSMLHHLLMSK